MGWGRGAGGADTQLILTANIVTLAYYGGGLKMTILRVLTDGIFIKNPEAGHTIISIYQVKKPSHSHVSQK